MEAIRVENITKNYKDVRALDNVSLEIKENETFGLLGVNGAGKTTLIKILTTLSKPTSGEAFIYDKSILKNKDEIKKIIDISPQETSVAMNLTVKENINFFKKLYEINDEPHINWIIEAFALTKVLNKKAKTLSGGWQRRLSIAISLISKPKVLFLDEPTLGLDVISRAELWAIIKKLKKSMTIIITSHYLEEIEELCDRVSIMSEGHILEIGTVEEIKDKAKCSSFEKAFIKIVGGVNNGEY